MNSEALSTLQKVRKQLIDTLYWNKKKDVPLAVNINIARDAIDRAIEDILREGSK